jgi:hypothetical protein
MQAKAFPVARGDTSVAQMPFVSQVPLAWQGKDGEDLVADRFSSKQKPEEAKNKICSLISSPISSRFKAGPYEPEFFANCSILSMAILQTMR